MPEKSQAVKLQNIHELVDKFDQELKNKFGAVHFQAGRCLLLGRHYAESPYIYFSLNPGFPRDRSVQPLICTEDYNIPFVNPEHLKKQYVYLHNCQRFFSTYPSLNNWINQGVTSAFLVPWRTSNMSDLRRLNQVTQGQLFVRAGQLARQIICDHKAKLLITAGKSALQLMNELSVIEGAIKTIMSSGPGGSYQWSKSIVVIEGTERTILQIPHFSRANAANKMRALGTWLMEELTAFGCKR